MLYIKNYTNKNFVRLMPEQTLRHAIEAFIEHKQHIMCVMEKEQLLGLITKPAVHRAILKDPTLCTPLRDIMKTKIVSVYTTHTVEEAKDILLNGQVGHAIVYTPQQQIYGIISTEDLIQMFLARVQNLTTYMHTLIENMHDAVITVNQALLITGFNKAAISIYPFLQSNFLHAPIQAIDATLQVPLHEVMQKQLTTNEIISIQVRKFIATFVPLMEQGQLVGAMTTFRDITEIEAISTQLETTKKLEKMLDMAMELSFDAVCIVDEAGTIIRSNLGFATFFQESASYTTLKDVAPPIYELYAQQIDATVIELQEKKCFVSCKPLQEGTKKFGTLITIMHEQLSVWKNVLEQIEVIEQNVPMLKQSTDRLQHQENVFSSIKSISPAMLRLKKEAYIAADSHLPIFITGENGTGKSLLAKHIHEASKRKGAFVTVNCAAIPEQLIEAEFFGYTEGAFTGAKRGGRKGKFELAHGGTLFLDEIGDMPLAMQAKLLRVLQEKQFERLGDHQTITVDVRIITATNKNIEQLVATNQFREDLYYRIHVIHLQIPALRQRTEDIAHLAQTFIQQIAEREQKRMQQLSQQAIQLLEAFNWPGNVRQLENMMERACHFCKEHVILPQHLPPEIQQLTHTETKSRKDMHEELEKQLLIDTLETCAGNKSLAAKQLGISRTALYNKLKQFKLLESTTVN